MDSPLMQSHQLAPVRGLVVQPDPQLLGRVIPIRFTLDQDSNAHVERALVDPAWRGLTVGMDDVRLDVKAVFIPVDGYTSPEICGVDHLPCLKAILPLYQWAPVSVQFEAVEPLRTPLAGEVRALPVCLDQYVRVKFVGTKLPEEAL